MPLSGMSRGGCAGVAPGGGEGIMSTPDVGRLQMPQRGGWRRARTRVLAGDDLVDSAAVVDDVEFAGLVFPEGTDTEPRRKQLLHHPAAAPPPGRPRRWRGSARWFCPPSRG